MVSLIKFLAICAVFTTSLAWGFGLDTEVRKGDVAVVPLHGEISKAQLFFLRRVLKQAEAAGVSAFVLDMNTPGGRLDVAVEMINLLSKASVPTLTYVNDNAASAGALIALGTREIWMAPVSAIGAAAPVMSSGGEIPETMNAKVVSYYSGYFRAAASRNGYSPEIAQAFIDKDKEVKIGERVIHEKGKPLTLDPQQATEEIDGKALLAKGIADSVSDLVQKAHLTGEVRQITPSGFERMAFWITTLSPLLLLLGISGVYLEMKTPGFGIAGTLAAICFLLFFVGHYVAGLTGFEVIAVFVFGGILVLIEVFVFPGVFVFGVGGVLLMMGSLIFAMTDRFPGEGWVPSLDALKLPVLNLFIAMGLASILISFLATRIASLPGFGRLVLTTAQIPGTSLPAPVAVEALIPGVRGVALSILRPSGRAQFGDTVCDVLAEGEFIPAGTPVEIMRREGASYVVVAVSEESA